MFLTELHCIRCKIFCISTKECTKYCDSLYTGFFIFLHSIVFTYWPFVDGSTMNISCQMNSADKDSICGLHYDCDVFSPSLITHFMKSPKQHSYLEAGVPHWAIYFLVDKGQQIERLIAILPESHYNRIIKDVCKCNDWQYLCWLGDWSWVLSFGRASPEL